MLNPELIFRLGKMKCWWIDAITGGRLAYPVYSHSKQKCEILKIHKYKYSNTQVQMHKYICNVTKNVGNLQRMMCCCQEKDLRSKSGVWWCWSRGAGSRLLKQFFSGQRSLFLDAAPLDFDISPKPTCFSRRWGDEDLCNKYLFF